MNNYILKIAKNNIRKDKKLYRYMFISIFVTFFILVLSHVLTESFQYVTYLANIDIHGKWDMALMNTTQEDQVAVMNDDNITSIGHLYIGGEAFIQDRNLGYIGYYDDVGLELANLQLKEGHFANNEEEVVIEEAVQEEYQFSINQNIKVRYEYNNQSYQKDYKIVGIVKNYSTEWKSRGLTFITSQLKENETDLLVCADNIFNLWSQYSKGLKNTYIYPEYKVTFGMNSDIIPETYTNESYTLQNMMEIVIISFVAILCTTMSSLNKRESQFVMLRSIGMTYQQLQRLIIYECIILVAITVVLSIVLGLVTSYCVIYVYTSIVGLAFGWKISLFSFALEIVISMIILYIGMILPTLTVYDLPLTRKNGEYIYHPHQRKIKKPTFLRMIKNDILLHKGHHIFMIILVVFISARATTSIKYINQYFIDTNIVNFQKYEGDYIWNNYYRIDDYELDFSSFQNNAHIHMNSICMSRYLTDMIDNQEISVVCIEEDEEVKEAIHYQDIKDNEAIILLYEDNKRQFDQYINIIDYDIMKTYKMTGISHLSKNIVRDYINSKSISSFYQDEENFAIVVNKNTYKKLTGNDICNHIIINVDDEISKIQVHNYFMNQIHLKNLQGVSQIFIDAKYEKNIAMYNLNEKLIGQLIYTILIFVALLIIIFLIRLMIVHKLKREIGMFQIIGMTKKRIYVMYGFESFLMCIVCMCILFVYWFVFENQASMQMFMNNIDIYMISLFIIGILYILCDLLSVQRILKHKSLDLINERFD